LLTRPRSFAPAFSTLGAGRNRNEDYTRFCLGSEGYSMARCSNRSTHLAHSLALPPPLRPVTPKSRWLFSLLRVCIPLRPLKTSRWSWGDCSSRASADPYVPAFEHTVPHQIMVSLRDEAWNELRVREQAGSDGAIRRISPSASSGCCCGDSATDTLAMT